MNIQLIETDLNNGSYVLINNTFYVSGPCVFGLSSKGCDNVLIGARERFFTPALLAKIIETQKPNDGSRFLSRDKVRAHFNANYVVESDLLCDPFLALFYRVQDDKKIQSLSLIARQRNINIE
jgi:hypothetical protein